MKASSNPKLLFFGFSYAGFHAVAGVINLQYFQRPLLAIMVMIVYLVAIIISLGFTSKLYLPFPPSIACLIAASVIPGVSIFALGESAGSIYFAAWSVQGTATLLSVLAVRGHPFFAWVGTLIMSLEIVALGGFGAAAGSGLLGAVILVVACQWVASALIKSQDAAALAIEVAVANDLEREALSASRSASRVRAREALDSALPLLTIIQTKRGKITRDEAKMALIIEAGLRDQIRARGLLDEKLVDAVLKARVRGVEVQLLDDGGTDEITAGEKARIVGTLIIKLNQTTIGKVFIRSVSGEPWTVSMVATRPGVEAPDLFLRL